MPHRTAAEIQAMYSTLIYLTYVDYRQHKQRHNKAWRPTPKKVSRSEKEN